MSRLLSLPDDKHRIESPEYQEWVEKAKTYTAIFKRKHGFATTDPRFREATLTEILQDLLLDDAGVFLDQFEKWDRDTNAFAKAMAIDPKKAMKEEREKMAAQLNAILGRR